MVVVPPADLFLGRINSRSTSAGFRTHSLGEFLAFDFALFQDVIVNIIEFSRFICYDCHWLSLSIGLWFTWVRSAVLRAFVKTVRPNHLIELASGCRLPIVS